MDIAGKKSQIVEKKCVTLDIDIYIYRTFVWLFEMVFGVGPGGFDLGEYFSSWLRVWKSPDFDFERRARPGGW